LCKCQHVSVVLYCCKRSERERKWSFLIPDWSLVGCGTVTTGKRRRGLLLTTSGCIFGRISAFYLQSGNIFLFYQIVTTFSTSNNDFPNVSFRYGNKHFHILKRILYFVFCGTTDFWKQTSRFGSFCRSYALLFSTLRISEIQFYT
jgi:hypothetical protein